MIKRPFFGLGRPNLKYPVVEAQEQDIVKEIPVPDRVTLSLEDPYEPDEELSVKIGDKVKIGQKLKLKEDDIAYVISSVTGTIAGIYQYDGYLGKTYRTISIDTADKDKSDDQRSVLGNAGEFLGCLPGKPDFASFLDTQSTLNTIIINGVDKDLLIGINQLVVKTEFESLKSGIKYLRENTGASKIMMVVSPEVASQAEKTGADVKVIKSVYPNALPEIIMKNILGTVVPIGKSCEEMGVGFINAEAVLSIADAITKGQIPVNKMMTVIKKDYTTVDVSARIGTHTKEILDALDIEIQHGDRLVLGGPMMGHTIYSEDVPVSWDTDAIMVQDRDQINLSSDSQCLNCGECVRACPAKVPINMLVRVLENGLYEEAAIFFLALSVVFVAMCALRTSRYSIILCLASMNLLG
jgi:electron transport complex protein RnfC